jgi:hypothetical protein
MFIIFLRDPLIMGMKSNLLYFSSGSLGNCRFFVFSATGSSNGRTTVSGTVYLGSNPSPVALKIKLTIGISGTVYPGSNPSIPAKKRSIFAAGRSLARTILARGIKL